MEDWAAKAARRIKCEPRSVSEKRVAAIIATYARPILDLLHETIPPHADACARLGDDEGAPCTCGRRYWQEKLDAALGGEAVFRRDGR